MNKNEYCKITGVTSSETFSLGTITAQFCLENQIISHKIHIVDADFPIEQDGILGRDFFETNLCKIDYESFVLHVFYQNNSIEIPIQSSASVQSNELKFQQDAR